MSEAAWLCHRANTPQQVPMMACRRLAPFSRQRRPPPPRLSRRPTTTTTLCAHNADDALVFMSGHLMFFKNEPRVMEEFFNFPALKTSETWLATERRWIDPGAEEVDYSHFAMLNPNITFIRESCSSTLPPPTRTHSSIHCTSYVQTSAR